MRFHTTVPTFPDAPMDRIDAALETALMEGAKLVVAEGNRIMRSSNGGRHYGAHVAAALGQPPAVFTETLVKSGKAVEAKNRPPHVAGAVAEWTAPHAHLMADGFMHKPHRPKTAFVPGKHQSKKWGRNETPEGSVFVPPRPFAQPAGRAMYAACNDLVKAALDKAAKP